MDHNVRAPVTTGLRLRGVDVLTAYEDGHRTVDDPVLLDRATELAPVLFSQDEDLLGSSAGSEKSVAAITFRSGAPVG